MRRRGQTAAPAASEFAIRVATIDDLFVALDARPLAQRPLNDAVRVKLLDEWDRVRATGPTALHIHAPAAERAGIDERAVRAALTSDMRAHTRRLHYANPLTRRERVAVWSGFVIFVFTIALSTLLDRISTALIVGGVSQGIVVIGWVALWDPAQRLAGDVVPHYFARKRYVELAEIDVRFVWYGAEGTPAPASRATDSALEVTHDGY